MAAGPRKGSSSRSSSMRKTATTALSGRQRCPDPTGRSAVRRFLRRWTQTCRCHSTSNLAAIVVGSFDRLWIRQILFDGGAFGNCSLGVGALGSGLRCLRSQLQNVGCGSRCLHSASVKAARRNLMENTFASLCPKAEADIPRMDPSRSRSPIGSGGPRRRVADIKVPGCYVAAGTTFSPRDSESLQCSPTERRISGCARKVEAHPRPLAARGPEGAGWDCDFWTGRRDEPVGPTRRMFRLLSKTNRTKLRSVLRHPCS